MNHPPALNAPELGFQWNIASELPPLALDATLAGGQAFRWRKQGDGLWHGAIGSVAVALWRANSSVESPLFWQTFPEPNQWGILADYLRLDVPLNELIAGWGVDEFADLQGLRILRQPPEECLFAFLCATCNTVIKIERSVTLLAERYGQPIDAPFHAVEFPSMAQLAEADEAVLRGDLWGYRAPRVISTAQTLLSRPPGFLRSLRGQPLEAIRAELTALHGIGTKLADCIALFSLDCDEAVPVDTHVRQIAIERFAPHLEGKSLTPRVYAEIDGAYRARFGDYAGWAQQYLFYATLSRAKTVTQC